MIASGKDILVHFNYSSNQSEKIPDPIRKELQKHTAK